MREIAEMAQSLSGSPATLVRVVKFEGFGGRREGEALLVSADGSRVGSLLSGAADAAIAGHDASVGAVVVVPVGDAPAVEAGLACGGTAHLLVQPLNRIPSAAWEFVAQREPFVVVSFLDGGRTGDSVLVSFAGVELGAGDAVADDVAEAASNHLRSGKSPTTTISSSDGTQVHLELVSAPPHAVVVGRAELSHAIERQGALLGWTTTTVDERVEGGTEACVAAAAALGRVDALIVLSHDLPASCAALATALRGRCGYVGALGSRHTQAARRERLLTVEGISDEQAGRVHGPIGLDLGSRTPEETSLAIFAEILAVRRGRSAASLSSVTTPIHG